MAKLQQLLARARSLSLLSHAGKEMHHLTSHKSELDVFLHLDVFIMSLSDLCRNCTAIIFLLTLLVDFPSSCRVSKRPVPRNEKPTAITTPPVVKKRRYVFLIFGSCFNILQSAQLVALSRCIELYQLPLQGEFLISGEGKTKLRNVC